MERDYDAEHQKDLERIKKLRLMDDTFMNKVFEDKACAQLLLRIILEKDDLIVERVHCQHDIKNLQGRSIRLDIFAYDSQGVQYDIEIQNENDGADPKRARYNSAMLDVNMTRAGDPHKELRESFVIFITGKDIIGDGLPIYHIDRVVRETGNSFKDGENIIYVNSSIQDETRLGKLMHDFYCQDAKDVNYHELAERIRFFKEEKEGVSTMCKLMEDMRKDVEEKTEKKTTIKNALNCARNLLNIGKLTYEEIADSVTCMNTEDVKILNEILNGADPKKDMECFAEKLLDRES